MINLVQKIISAAANQLSCANRVRYIKAYTRKWTTTTDGSASSPSSISATRTLGLIKEACEASLFPFPCIQLRARSRTSVSYDYMWTFCRYSATSTACKIMIVSTSSCVLTLVPHEVPSLQWHFCGSRSPGSQTYSDWWVVEPGNEWAIILYHYLKRMCVCFWCKFHLLKKDIMIAFPWTCIFSVVSASCPQGWLDWEHRVLYLSAITLTCNPELLIRSTCYDMPGLCCHWSSSKVWVVLSCVVFTPVCFISPACISLYLCQL